MPSLAVYHPSGHDGRHPRDVVFRSVKAAIRASSAVVSAPMQKLVALAMVLAMVSCSSKPKDDQTTVSTVPSGPVDPAAAGAETGSAAGAGTAAATDTAGATAPAAASATTPAGSAPVSASAAGHAADAAHAAAPASTFDFDKLTHEEKLDFMKKRVVPTMKPLFQEFDKKEFANFGCKTCHGKDPVKAKYKMPNAGLPKLDFAKLKQGKQSPKAAEWMANVVVPAMAKLFQMPEYTEENPTGFGCLHCHVTKQ